MRPRIDTVGDDALEDYGVLKYTDDTLRSTFLASFNTMRKHRLFCDVILNVESTDFHVHRNVMASVSPHLMELFSAEQQTQKVVTGEGIPSYMLNGGMTKVAMQILIDYAYTSFLEVPDALVKDVYLAAWKLRMEAVVNECARHLITELTADSCIEIRSLPGISGNKTLIAALDTFINSNFAEVGQSAGFLQMPCIQIEVLYQTKQEMTIVSHNSIARLVLDWMKRQLNTEELTMDNLMERSHLLYLAMDNSLQDCGDLPPGHESETELVQDYKRLVLKCPNNKSRRKCLAQTTRPRVLIYSRDISEREEKLPIDADWNLIGSTKMGENSFVSVVTLNGMLSRISMQLRLNTPAPVPPSPIGLVPESPLPFKAADSLDSVGTSSNASDDPQTAELFCEVAVMAGSKCSLGVAELDGKMLVCGGYDRGECLRAVESYCPDKNVWVQEANMREARGRVQIAVIDGTVFAVGGSNGTTELDTVESLQKGMQKWSKCCSLPLARSNAGVCALNGLLYCIGGWNGQSGIKQCDVFDPAENKWSSISSLNTGRTQAGVAAYRGKVWAVGGSDAWNCLATVEVYKPGTNVWQQGPNVLTARRGCGLAELNGKLYAIGGSDGNHALNSTEVYDEDTKTWTIGPTLTSPRANVSAVVVRDRLYAVGGFSGKTFLNTIEYLDPETNEWTTFVPQQDIDLANIEQSLKEVVENGFKSVSPIPPSTLAVLSQTAPDQNGTNHGTNGVNGRSHISEEFDHSEDDEEEEDDLNDRRPSVKTIKGCDVLYSSRNGKLDEDANGHPRVADSEGDADELMTPTTIVNGSS